MENKWMELKESYCLKFQNHFLMADVSYQKPCFDIFAFLWWASNICEES